MIENVFGFQVSSGSDHSVEAENFALNIDLHRPVPVSRKLRFGQSIKGIRDVLLDAIDISRRLNLPIRSELRQERKHRYARAHQCKERGPMLRFPSAGVKPHHWVSRRGWRSDDVLLGNLILSIRGYVMISKAMSGVGKIDPLTALFDTAFLMRTIPEPLLDEAKMHGAVKLPY